VKKPGVYHLPPQARADDAVKAAGGATEDANLDAVNLAAHLQDGKQLYIPTHKEHPTGGADDQIDASQPDATSAVSPTSRPTVQAHGSPRKGAGSRGRSTSHGNKLTTPGQGTVNINTASAEELQRLPGVGPGMAARIIEFRKENHGFANAEQLMDVSGIGEGRYAKMKPFVRVH
jgi:competence protein ComEA